MRHKYLLSRHRSALIIVDMQELLMKEVVNNKEITTNTLKIIEAAKILGLPILLTEHVSRVFGSTLSEIKSQLSNYAPMEKIIFSCFGVDDFKRRLAETGKKQIIIVGIETHICVAQTALDAVSEGYDVHVVYDAVSARSSQDHQIGLNKMQIGGVIPCSTEIAIFDLLERAGTDEFRAILPLIKKKT